MNILISVLGIVNILLGVASIPPCLMAGLMVFDAPGSTESITHHIVSFLFLTFPLICLICGITVLWSSNWWSIYLALFPISEASLVIFIFWVFSGTSI
jgi:hypothetical protein